MVVYNPEGVESSSGIHTRSICDDVQENTSQSEIQEWATVKRVPNSSVESGVTELLSVTLQEMNGDLAVRVCQPVCSPCVLILDSVGACPRDPAWAQDASDSNMVFRSDDDAAEDEDDYDDAALPPHSLDEGSRFGVFIRENIIPSEISWSPLSSKIYAAREKLG